MLPLLLCVTLFCIAIRSTSAHYSPEEVLKKCKFVYSSKFHMELSKGHFHGSWKYDFNVNDQIVKIYGLLDHDNPFEVKQGIFNYKKKTVELSCQNRFNFNNNPVKKELNESLALPTTFPPPDTVYCGDDGLHGRLASLFVYYSKKYDLSFTIGLTAGELHGSLGTCTLVSFGLPGQKKDGYTCFKSDETKKLWAVDSFPNC